MNMNMSMEHEHEHDAWSMNMTMEHERDLAAGMAVNEQLAGTTVKTQAATKRRR